MSFVEISKNVWVNPDNVAMVETDRSMQDSVLVYLLSGSCVHLPQAVKIEDVIEKLNASGHADVVQNYYHNRVEDEPKPKTKMLCAASKCGFKRVATDGVVECDNTKCEVRTVRTG